MQRFKVRVTGLASVPAFGVNGERVMEASFCIESPAGTRYEYAGSGMGAEFADRCERMRRLTQLVEAPEPDTSDLEQWKETVVRRAMEQVATSMQHEIA